MKTQRYLDMVNKAALNAKIKITQETELEIIKLYDMAIQDLINKLKKENNKLSRQFIKSRIRMLNAELEKIIENSSSGAAKAACKNHEDVLNKIMSKSGKKLKFDSLFSNIPNDVLAVMKEGKIYKDGAGLSSRIWNYGGANSKYIEDIIYTGLAEGTSAVDLAKMLETYVKPSSRKYWSNDKIKELLGEGYAQRQEQIEYNALRLARTTITHSFTLGNKLSAERNPFVTHMKWHSVFAHGRTCEVCKERDGKIFTIKELPFDHPNGLCWEEPVYEKSLDEYAKEIRNWIDGGNNSNLDKWYAEYGKFFI